MILFFNYLFIKDFSARKNIDSAAKIIRFSTAF